MSDVAALLDPPSWHDRATGGRDAGNLAATALVAAKVYEAYGWVRWNGNPRGSSGDPEQYHVPDAEAILKVLHDLGCMALDRMGEEHNREVGVLRFSAYADDDGPDSYVNFSLSIGEADASEFRAIRERAIGASPYFGRHLDGSGSHMESETP